MVFRMEGLVRDWCLQLRDGVGTSHAVLPRALASFLTVVPVHLVPPQPVITACGLWKRQRKMPSGCWGRAPWCCLTRSSAASGKTCTSSVPGARYGAAGRDCGLVGVADSFTASIQPSACAALRWVSAFPFCIVMAKDLGLRWA